MSSYKMEDVIAQAEEAAGGTDVEFEFKGELFKFPNPLFCDDDWQNGFQDVTTSEDNARYLLGDEQYDKFRAAGGQSSFVMLVLGQSQRDTAAAMTDGTPTRSSSSSVNARKRSRRR